VIQERHVTRRTLAECKAASFAESVAGLADRCRRYQQLLTLHTLAREPAATGPYSVALQAPYPRVLKKRFSVTTQASTTGQQLLHCTLRTHDPSKRTAEGPRLRPHGHWARLGSNPGLQGGRPATNRLSHDTAVMHTLWYKGVMSVWGISLLRLGIWIRRPLETYSVQFRR
jgi:hypothetical protein